MQAKKVDDQEEALELSPRLKNGCACICFKRLTVLYICVVGGFFARIGKREELKT